MIRWVAIGVMAVLSTVCYATAGSVSELGYAVKDIFFGRGGNAWVLTTPGEMVSTTDGGVSWQQGFLNSDAARIAFVDDQLGWGIGRNGNVYKTLDGGKTWQLTSNMRTKGPVSSIGDIVVQEAEFTDPSHGWVLSPFGIMRTKDGGESWQSAGVGGAESWFSCLHFVDERVGWISEVDGKTYLTLDGGETWKQQGSPEERGAIHSVAFVSRRIGWLGTNRGIYHTADGGGTWTKQTLPKAGLHVSSMQFLNERQGWATVVDFQPEPPGKLWFKSVLLHTMNGGVVWRMADAPNGEEFYNKVCFSDTQRGWLYTDTVLYRTESGGLSWNPVLKYPRSTHRID